VKYFIAILYIAFFTFNYVWFGSMILFGIGAFGGKADTLIEKLLWFFFTFPFDYLGFSKNIDYLMGLSISNGVFWSLVILFIGKYFLKLKN
jgi:hypothetical protein